MPFVSSLFLGCYLPLLWLLTSLTRRYSIRFWILLIFSAIFYWWAEPLYFTPLVVCILVTFVSGVALTKYPRSKFWLLLGVGISLGQLFWIKYGQFVFAQLLAVGVSIPQSWIFPQHLPLGLSFFTFHAVSYLIDVYRREVAATRSLPFLAQYFLFFPHQIAGPIVRFKTFAPPAETMAPTPDDIAYGVERFVLGLAKKLLLADTFAMAANHIFGAQLGDISTPLAWAGTISYSLQIYFDFSGYSDMAIGLALMFSIQLSNLQVHKG